MRRPVVVTKFRAGIYRGLIELAGRGLLWPVVILGAIVLGVVLTVLTWPLVPILWGIVVVIVVIAVVLAGTAGN